MSQMIDPRQPRLGQGITGVAALVAFVLGLPILMPVVAAVLGLASIFGAPANLYVYLYRSFKRALKLGPPKYLEESWPPRFANICGFVILGVASVAYFAFGMHTFAWVLDLIVAALALLSAITGLCVGCELFVIGRRIATRGRVAKRITQPAGGGS